MDTVGVVVLNYINYKDTINCVDSLFKQQGVDLHIVVVDNGSPSGSYLRLTEYKFAGAVTIIRNEINAGYASGNNVGIREIMRLGIKWVLILNPDAFFPNKFAIITLLEDVKKLRSVGVIGPQVVTKRGRKILPYFFSPNLFTIFFETYIRTILYPLWKLFGRHLFKVPFKVHRVYGCCMLGSTEVWNKVGLLDESTFLYWEETILSHKLDKIGYFTYYTPRSTVVHCHEVDKARDECLISYEIKSMEYFLIYYLGYGSFRIRVAKIGLLISSFLKRLVLMNISVWQSHDSVLK